MSKPAQWRHALHRADTMCQRLRGQLSDICYLTEGKSDGDYSEDERVKITARLDILLAQLSTLNDWPTKEIKTLTRRKVAYKD